MDERSNGAEASLGRTLPAPRSGHALAPPGRPTRRAPSAPPRRL